MKTDLFATLNTHLRSFVSGGQVPLFIVRFIDQQNGGEE
jgi:hypothetical protein